MPESYMSKYVLCPFYRKEEKNKICCEGIEKDTSLNLIFLSVERRKDFEKRFCCADYRRCYISEMLSKKWKKYFEGGLHKAQ